MSSPIERTVAQAALTNPYLLEDATLLRQEAGTRVAGVFHEASPVSTSIRCVTAPVGPKERDTLPEGFRESQLRTFWFRGDAQPVVEGESTGDRINYNGETYRIIRAHRWGRAFTEAIATITDPASIVDTLVDFDPADFSMEDWG